MDTRPTTDPDALLRARDGIYADDLLIAAVAHLDLFTALAEEPGDIAHMARLLGLALRPADVMSTLLRAMGVLEPGPTLRPTPLAAEHLVRGAPCDLRPYLASLAQRPACLELLEVVRTDQPAPWASTAGGRTWTEEMGDEGFAETITAAMDARGASLAPTMAAAIADLPATSVVDVAGGSGVYACALLEASMPSPPGVGWSTTTPTSTGTRPGRCRWRATRCCSCTPLRASAGPWPSSRR